MRSDSWGDAIGALARLSTLRRRRPGFALVAVVFALLGGSLDGAAAALAQSPQAATYVCPMHPDVTSSAPGACARCGMALVKADTFEARDYLLEVETTPRAPRAGDAARLRLTVRHPATGTAVREFAIVHEKIYHLFVISHDLKHYDHVHPEQQPDGSLAIEVTLPRPGYYKLYSDFLPVGGTPQVVPQVLVTAGVTGDLASSRARLVPDKTLRRTAGSLTVTLELPAGGLVAGREEKLLYHIADAKSGAPVTDVEPYLGAYGHALVMSEDTLHYVHAHPVEQLPEGAVKPGGGPDLTFEALLPKPGRYRIWTQIKRAGVVATLAFTVEAASPAAGIATNPGRP